MVYNILVLAWTKGLMGTLLVILGTAFITFLGIGLFLRVLFKSFETFEHIDIDDEWKKYYEINRR